MESIHSGAGKIYQINFAAQYDSPCYLASENEYIPLALRNPLISDQTWRYHKTVDLSLPFSYKSRSRLAYLCFFSPKGDNLVPVAWGEINKKKKRVLFKQVPADMVFFPVYYESDEAVPFASPFYVDSRGVARFAQCPLSTTYNDNRKVIATKSRKEYKIEKSIQTLRVTRKYPDKSRLRTFRQEMPGTLLLGSNDISGQFDTLYELKTVPYPFLQKASIQRDKEYRYFLLRTKGGKPLNLSHFEIIGPKDVLHDTLKPSTLPIFSRDVLADDTTLARYPYSNVVGLSDADAVSSISDSDPLTFTTESSLIVDAGSPVAISEIRFAPRNACNIIVPGDVYSLYYYDSGWRFHSRQTAVFNFLEFDGVPEGTLYWVADETQGSEELPFSYENGAQHFINNYSPDRILKE